MNSRWEQGRVTVDQLITDGRLQQVTASRELAEVMIVRARTHLRTASDALDSDPTGAFQMAYDAARKALAAILANQGLRATTAPGAHAVLLETCLAQLDPPMGRTLKHFDWMRRTRNNAEYPTLDSPEISRDDVADAIRLSPDPPIHRCYATPYWRSGRVVQTPTCPQHASVCPPHPYEAQPSPSGAARHTSDRCIPV